MTLLLLHGRFSVQLLGFVVRRWYVWGLLGYNVAGGKGLGGKVTISGSRNVSKLVLAVSLRVNWRTLR